MSDNYSALADEHNRSGFHRNIGLISNFSLGFTYLSPLVGIYSLLAFALTLAGPASMWWILLIACGQMLVALVFGEIASQYPITGGLYPWTRRLWGRRYAWLAAWVYLCALVVTITSVVEYSSTFIASLFGYQTNPAYDLMAAIGMLVLALIFNLSGTTMLARVTTFGFWAEIIGVVGIGIYLLLFARVNDFSVLFDSMGVLADDGTYFTAFTSAALLGLWMFFGFEACGNVAEEVRNPSRGIPKAMILSIVFGAISALVSFAGYLLAAPNLQGIVDGTVTDPIPEILNGALGPVGAKLFLVVALMAFISCALSLQAALSRLIFSFARDDMLPASSWLKKLNVRHAVPNNAMIAACVLPMFVCMIVYLMPESLYRITGFAVIGIYLSFLMVTVAALRQRLKGWRPAGEWSLGGFGWPVNIAAIAFQLWGMYLLAQPGGDDVPFLDRWIVLVGICTVLVLGVIYMILTRPYGKSDAPEGDAISYAAKLRASR